MTTLKNALRLLQLQIQQSQSPAISAFGAAPYHPGTPTLPPPQVPALLVHNGLNKNDLHDPSVPVAVQVVLRLDMLENDDLPLYLNDTAVAVETLRPEHVESGIVTFYLLPSVFPQEGQVTLHYHHRVPPSDSFSVSENAGPFLVKQTVPGDPDPEPATPTINERLTPPTGIPNPVPPSQPLTVTIPRYVNIASDDKIVLHWSNREIHKTVTADEASNSGAPLTVIVPPDIINSTPGLDLIVRYEIHDTVMNWSLYSLEAYADVEPPGALHAPTVRDANDYDELDMDELDGDEVAIQIPVNGNLSVGTEGVLTWTGIPVIGPRLTFTLAFKIERMATRITLMMPNEKATALVGSTATVYYEATLNGVSTPSQRTSVVVIGEPVSLEKPTLTGVPGDTYNPASVIGTHQEVVVPAYGFMARGQAVILHWEGRTASGSPFYFQERKALTSDTQQDIKFLIDKVYATGLGTNTILKVYYEIVAEGTNYASPTLELTVVGVPSNLPKPTTDPVFTNGEIDPGAIVDAIEIVIEPNSSLAPGDLLTVKWLGRSNASIILTDQVFPRSGNLEIRIGKTPYIDGNSNGYVDVSYEARRNGQPVGSSQVLQLHVGAASEQPWPLPKVVDGTGGEVSTWQPVKPGTSYESNTATVIVTDSRIQAGDIVAVIWRLPGGTDLTVPWITAGAGEGRVPVPSTVLARSLGQTVQVGYVVFRGAGADLVGNSALANLQMGALNATILKAPVIVEATANLNRVDLNTFAGSAHVYIEPWPLIASGQMFWLYARGVFDDGSSYSERLPAPYTVQAGDVVGGLRRDLARSLLLRLENATALRLELKIDLTGTGVESSATLCPIGEFQMTTVKLVLPPPIVANVINGHLDPADIPAAGVNVLIPAYVGREAGQWVYAEFHGQSGSSEVGLEKEVVDVSTPIDFMISKAEVVKNADQAAVFEYRVARTREGAYLASLPVPVEIAKETTSPVPGNDGFEDVDLGNYVQLQRPGYRITSDDGFWVKNVMSASPYVAGNYLESSNVSDIVFHFPKGIYSFRIGIHAEEAHYMFVWVGSDEVPIHYQAGSQWIEYSVGSSVPQSAAITGFMVGYNHTPCQIDNISFVDWGSSHQ